MKNIHILPTDKPSRLFRLAGDLHLHEECGVDSKRNQNIYITSDEEIETDEYYFHLKNNEYYNSGRIEELDKDMKFWKKIILTTDQDLIKDGVQSIDDEFLEWFVKNPSCEEVEVVKTAPIRPFGSLYKIIIPKEEPKQELENHYLSTPNPLVDTFRMKLDNHPDLHKQETLEEYQEALKQFPEYDQYLERIGFEAGAKWQQERSYSEEEIYNLIQAGYSFCEKGKNREDVKNWFEQFKKK